MENPDESALPHNNTASPRSCKPSPFFTPSRPAAAQDEYALVRRSGAGRAIR
jgi:hypothetical protein